MQIKTPNFILDTIYKIYINPNCCDKQVIYKVKYETVKNKFTISYLKIYDYD